MGVTKKLILVLFYNIVIQILQTSSRTSYFWKLNAEKKVIGAGKSDDSESDDAGEISDDPVFNIIISTENYGDFWIKTNPGDCDSFCSDGYKLNSSTQIAPKPLLYIAPPNEQKIVNRLNLHDQQSKEEVQVSDIKLKQEQNQTEQQAEEKLVLNQTIKHNPEDDEVLDCGKPAQSTHYDKLLGIVNRLTHPNASEHQLSLIFKKKGNIDIDALERKLKKAKRDKPKSVQLYNRIGNFWRIKGDTNRSIECFRRALAVSPNNAEVLLNLARVLFVVKYYDDAIYLTRKSLEVQPPDKSAWQQYFTLGEIFKASGHYQEALLHIRHCLQLKPGHEPALELLKILEKYPHTTMHVCTLLIIVFLVTGVLLVIISLADSSLYKESLQHSQCPARHCHRDPPIRSFKMGFSSRSMRSRRYN